MSEKVTPFRKRSFTGMLIPIRRVEGITREMSDDALLTACAAGEAAALGALFDRYGERVSSFLARITTGTRQDVLDLLQATFMQAQRSARRFQKRASVSTWLLGIAVNVARHHSRGEKRRLKAHAALAHEQPARTVTPGEETERRELLGRLSAGIRTLPDDVRMVYVMCEIEELPGREVARALGMSEATVWRRLHDARERLRQIITRTGR